VAQKTRARKNVESIKKKVDMEIEVQPKDTSRGHFYVSVVKSAVRIGAGTALIMGSLAVCGWLLILAEILGVVEELV
jgi:hypothetical protein